MSVVEATPTPTQEPAGGGVPPVPPIPPTPASGGASGESTAAPGAAGGATPGAGSAAAEEAGVTTDEVLDWMKENSPTLIVAFLGLVGGGIFFVMFLNIVSNLLTDLVKGIGGLVFRRFRRR